LGAVLVFALTRVPLSAQTSPDQRRVDFEQLAAAVAKSYAPYAWKIQAFQYDALQLKPWLDRVAKTTDDLSYYELCMEYVASLQDLHSGFFIRSGFAAEIPIYVDLYDGKALIEYVDRAALPASRFPFETGDEVVSVDGVTPEAWMDYAGKLQSFANPRATRRWALDQIAYRMQSTLPRAHQIGVDAALVVRRAATGAVETYRLPWAKSGTPLTTIGPVPTPTRGGAGRGAATDDGWPEELRSLLTRRRAPSSKRLRGFGVTAPVFNLPSDFQLRLGRGRSDYIFTGAYQSSGFRIGFLRIPEFPLPASAQSAMLRQVDSEVAWLKANTDGLVLDVMRNPGGDQCLANQILRRLIPYSFRTTGDEIRPTLEIVQWFRDDLRNAIDFGADPVTIRYLRGFLSDIEKAYWEFRGITGPQPVCDFSLDLEPVTDSSGNVLAHDKPMIVLIDEFSTSAADSFPAVIQDAWRALMVGKATAGGGGLSLEFPTGFYSEASVVLSYSLGTRAQAWQAPGLPPSTYIENVGVQPDIDIDYMTRQNLMTGGRDFVEAFTQAIVDHIRRSTAP
jgi:hypothetical protein